MRKLQIIDKTASKHSKLWLIVDENVEHLAPFLKEKGYNVSVFPSGTKDEIIHKEINKARKSEVSKKPHILITQDWDDFWKLLGRKYHILALRYKNIPEGDALANKIDELLRYTALSDFPDGTLTPLSPEMKFKKGK